MRVLAPFGTGEQAQVEGLKRRRSSPGTSAACGAPTLLTKLMDGARRDY